MKVKDKYMCPEPGCARSFHSRQGLNVHRVRIHRGIRWNNSGMLKTKPVHPPLVPKRKSPKRRAWAQLEGPELVPIPVTRKYTKRKYVKRTPIKERQIAALQSPWPPPVQYCPQCGYHVAALNLAMNAVNRLKEI